MRPVPECPKCGWDENTYLGRIEADPPIGLDREVDLWACDSCFEEFEVPTP